ncbi:MAG TPA: hypothetical protein VNO23_04105 [Candidatus Binatia bacterium]|nr:hypothetical protein [Candidatus Binatia bacterium]
MKRVAIALGLLMVFAATPVLAAPTFSLGGYTGPIFIKFRNFESFLDPDQNGIDPGDENFGIVNITNITDPLGNNLWTSGGSNGFLAGVFADVIVQSVTPFGGGFDVESTGGILDIYLSSTAPNAGQGHAGYAAGGCAPGDLCYNTISNTADGILFLRLTFASGIDPTDGTVTVDGTFDTSTFPTTGDAAAFANVTGGAFAGMFDSDGLPTAFGPRDVFFTNRFCPNGAPGCFGGVTIGDWQLQSDDPASAIVVTQPATVLLLGTGLLGLATMVRRRRVR